MSGTVSGGISASNTNKKNDPNFYKRVGSLGGKAKKTKPAGFAAYPKRARIYAALGGLKRQKAPLSQDQQQERLAKRQRLLNELEEIIKQEREL